MSEPAPPYVAADPVVPVRVLIAGERRDGWVLGWRGNRVYVRWSAGLGLNHLVWVPATAVERAADGNVLLRTGVDPEEA